MIPFNEFWDAIKASHYVNGVLESEVQSSDYIMNRLSNPELVSAPIGGIQAAIDAVDRLEKALEEIVNPP